MLISPNHCDGDWQRLDLSDPAANDGDWQKATDIIADRIRGRFVKWIEKLKDERFSGFVILALHCILIESLFGFETGKASPGNSSVYERFLTRDAFTLGGFDKQAAESFCTCIRNGIVHDSETRKGWLIEKTVPVGRILDGNASSGYRLNRTEFHKAIVAEFDAWLEKVRRGDNEARQKMRDRMKEIIEKSAPSAE